MGNLFSIKHRQPLLNRRPSDEIGTLRIQYDMDTGYAITAGREKLIASMSGTMMALVGREGIQQ